MSEIKDLLEEIKNLECPELAEGFISMLKRQSAKQGFIDGWVCNHNICSNLIDRIFSLLNKPECETKLDSYYHEKFLALIEKYGDPQYKTNEFALYDVISVAQQLQSQLTELKQKNQCQETVLEEIEAVACGEEQIQSDGVYNDSDGLKWIYDRIQTHNPTPESR